MGKSADELLRLWEALKARRHSFDNRWQRITDLIYVTGADSTDFEQTQGESLTERQYDPVATLALMKYAAVMESLLTPRGRKWHELQATDASLNRQHRVKQWFDEARNALFYARENPRARYYDTRAVGWQQDGATGNDCQLVLGRETGGIRYQAVPVPNVWVSQDADSIVDVVFRLKRLTARSAVRFFGDSAPPLALDDMKKDPFRERPYLHVVMPREDVDIERLDSAGMPWAAYWLAVEDKKMLQEDGYRLNPYQFARGTMRKHDEDYGRGPADLVLPAVETANEMKRDILEAGEIVARPPILLPPDGLIGSHDNGELDLRSGAMIYGGVDERGNQLARPFVSGARLDITREMMEDEHNTIEDPFLVGLFRALVDHPNMTATQVLEIAREKATLITPMVGSRQSELLGPQIERELQILQDQGALPPPPPELVEAEGEYEIVYRSPATAMMKSDELLGATRLVETAAGLAAQFESKRAEIEAMVNAREVLRLSAEFGGVPTAMLRGDDEVDAILARDAQAAEQRELAEQAPGLAKAARDLSQAGV